MIVCYAIASQSDLATVRYVGATHKTLRARGHAHRSDIYNRRKARWMAIGSPVIFPLSYHPSWSEAAFAEADWILTYWGPQLFNLRPVSVGPAQWIHNEFWAKRVRAEAAELGIDPEGYRFDSATTPKGVYLAALEAALAGNNQQGER